MSNIHDVMSSADLSAAVTAIATAYAKKEKAIRERNPMSSGVARVPRVVIGVAGRPGSGKTTATTILAEAVEQQLRSSSNPHRRSPGMLDSELPREVRWIYQQETGVQVVTMPMDGYHLTKKELSEMPNATEAFARRGAEWTFSPEKLTADLRALTTPNIGGTFDDVLVPSFDHAAGDPMERDVSIPGTAGVVLVEGNYLLYRGTPAWAAVNACFDLTIFLHCDRDQCMERLCRRHMKAWSISRAEAMKRAAGSDTINGDLIDTTKSNADVVIHSIEVHHSKL